MSKQTDLINIPDAITVSGSNVGIGTSSPSVELSIAGADPQLVLWEGADGASSSKVQLGTGTVQGFINVHKGDGTRTVQINSDGDSYFNGGNVGIGTSSPTLPLDIVSNAGADALKIRARPTSDDYGTLTFYNNAGTTKWADIQSNVAKDLRFYTNGGSEAMRIDSSGNLLVGTSGTNWTTTAGLYAFYQSALNVTRNGAESMNLNRLTNDGTIIGFRKDGSTVGSIGTTGGDLYIATGDTGIRFDDSADQIRASTSAGSNRDGAIDIGFTDSRFKDLYLSGGVYLGGTGADNHLHDYEEGLYTVTITLGSGSASLTSNKLFYTKIGRMVTISGIIRINSVSSPAGDIYFNVPFVNHNPSTGEDNTRATVQTNLVNSGNNNEVVLELEQNLSIARLYKSGTQSLAVAGNILKANTTLGINFSYFTST